MSKSVTNRPPKHELSSHFFLLLVQGYFRLIAKCKTDSAFPDPICDLCRNYYGKEIYLIVLNHRKLKLTVCATSANDIQLTSRNITKLNGIDSKNDDDNDYDFRGGSCFVRESKILEKLPSEIKSEMKDYNVNNKYNVIFKFDKRGKKCGLMFYDDNIDTDSFDVYYCKLPPVPFGRNMLSGENRNHPVYSDKYGLISMTNTEYNNNYYGKIQLLDINKLEWKIQDLDSNDKYKFPLYCSAPSYCLFENDNNQQLLFVVNGQETYGDYSVADCEETLIYNLETKKIETKIYNNKYGTKYSGICYDKIKKGMYIGGGDANCKTVVQFYDITKNEYFTLPATNNKHINPKLMVNQNDTTLHISSIDENYELKYEFIDVRDPQSGMSNKNWMNNKNMTQFGNNFWNKTERWSELSIIHWRQ